MNKYYFILFLTCLFAEAYPQEVHMDYTEALQPVEVQNNLQEYVEHCRQTEHFRYTLDLSGEWQFALDTADAGITERWYTVDLADHIQLPGTTDLRQKGFPNTDTTTRHLNRVYSYEGPAWYRKKIVVPETFRDRHLRLILERTKSSMIWIDDQPAGTSQLLQSPQFFDVTRSLTPGEHILTIRIDNSLELTPYGNVHIYSDDTQTNWNGIIGKIELEASSPAYISDLQVYPDVDNRKIDVRMKYEDPRDPERVNIELKIKHSFAGRKKELKPRRYMVPVDSVIWLEYPFEEQMQLWSDHRQPLYELTATSGEGDWKDGRTVPFGMREFAVRGTQFTINGRPVFLRGKNDACVFPLTGFPPMEVEGWQKVFRMARSYGINHYRFHSWCPPDAAFTAADLEGVYMQAELPFWGGLESDSLADMLLQEGIAMLENYANHPSFVMFSHGNEIWGGHDLVEKNIIALKDLDSRPLYTMGSNNNIGYVGPHECSDFFVAARTPYAHDTTLTHTRLTHAYADSREGGILNTRTPSTEVNFDFAVSQIQIPLISHEMGQYQVYPDYGEIEKYTGILRAWNLELFRDRLIQAGMMDQNADFQKASGAWSALCYKAEMEAALKTEGFAGFQLLDLQDFPGQGTALVGMLDAFMEEKDVIAREKWLQSCNDVVLLLKFPAYCLTGHEYFQAAVQVVNYSDRVLSDDLEWELVNRDDEVLRTGEITGLKIKNTGINDSGEIKCSLPASDDALQLEMKVRLRESDYSNTYPLWVYPDPPPEITDHDILVKEKLDEKTFTSLLQGGKVLLFPKAEDVKYNSTGGLFPPDFWNYGMFKTISETNNRPVSPGTLGILTDPGHPVFNEFPTDFHTNWQWFSIMKASRPLILDETETEYRPIVQVIDNLERNHKLGLIFEFKVGEGKMLVCMSRLNDIMDKPEAIQLYASLVHYMESSSFDPDYEPGLELLNELFR